MNKEIQEAIMYLEHTTIDDFNLENYQAENRIWAIKTLIEELQRKDNEINDLKSSIADYQKAVGDYQDELKKKNNMIKDAKEVLLTTNNIEKALNILDRIKELENDNK